MKQIQKTLNYSIFKKLSGNRPLDGSHLKKLKTSIKNDNQLSLHPIIVNNLFEIIDGQHRLKSAEDLGVEIYYIVSDSVKEGHLIDCNVNQKSFQVENYIEYFSIKGSNDSYVKLSEMLNSSKLKPKALLNLILGTVSPQLLMFLKTGKFRLPENKCYEKCLKDYLKFIEYLTDKRVRPISMFSNFLFTKAFRWLFNTNGFDISIFYKKLDLRWFDLKPQKGAQEWYELLISIYNFKNHNRLEIENGSL